MTQTECAVPECSAPVKSWGWCHKHYQRWLRHGTLHRRGAEERFWEKVRALPVDDPDACWLWQGALSGGYGQICGEWAHRFSYRFLVGPIPEGLQIDHLCRVRHCVNPDHLEPVTQQVNIRRGEWATRTHCVNGHPFDEANTYRPPSKPGWRYCRECFRLRDAERQRRIVHDPETGLTTDELAERAEERAADKQAERWAEL